MGCVGWNAMGEIAGYAGDAVGEMAGYAGDAASEVADATLHHVRGGAASTSEGSHFEIDASEVNVIELNWLAGSAPVRWPNARMAKLRRNDARRPATRYGLLTNDGAQCQLYGRATEACRDARSAHGARRWRFIPESAASLERFFGGCLRASTVSTGPTPCCARKWNSMSPRVPSQ